MGLLKRVVRYLGGTVALSGLAVATAFLGNRTADPLAASFVQPFTVWTQVLGISAGLVVLVLGLALVGQTGPASRW
ncbi:hypothetical protein [Haloarchaeobius sp. TZWSO28]|uniref:hypothetical protein n=1 Tax=unclassified Haloarchaeobius TaxID=2614452 RepID=UPI003EBC4C8F